MCRGFDQRSEQARQRDAGDDDRHQEKDSAADQRAGPDQWQPEIVAQTIVQTLAGGELHQPALPVVLDGNRSSSQRNAIKTRHEDAFFG
ncbi:hypothetical protein [Variovorax arabinosiphilus]|uniref:hypothetical protein n=1 Tax=Variovorax arabinosiphilus TaxID=3053498 RepID=UPI002576666F|nr:MULTISPECIES: hypothetical protein [unclassified Variovorax]MDM0118408.1 hypothetical protein [Variovorax sp. J2L1-78]MDM0128833.1 hypothetical protein [Variovorax sp. J2L1-63]MDM0233381.1 hypothetical protein [Variovorax sp. J2R1-6]